jgi:heme exporter protein D
MDEFFNMGGYGVYVWPSFGIVSLVMIGLALQSWLDLRTQKKLIAALEAASERNRT